MFLLVPAYPGCTGSKAVKRSLLLLLLYAAAILLFSKSVFETCILQAIFSVAQPHGDIFLVVKIEKVLQGSISGAVEQYLRTTDVKAGTKLHRMMMPYCQRLGNYRMPFAWGARYNLL